MMIFTLLTTIVLAFWFEIGSTKPQLDFLISTINELDEILNPAPKSSQTVIAPFRTKIEGLLILIFFFKFF